MTPPVLIQLLNYNNEALSIECVESLLRSDYPDFRVLLIDNGSEPASYRALMAKFGDEPRVSFLRIEKNRGFAGGNNFGVAHVRKNYPDAKYLFVVDNDTLHEPHTLWALVEAAEKRPGFAVLGPKICSFADRETVLSAGANVNHARGEGLELHKGEPCKSVKGFSEVGYVEGCAMLIRSDVLDEGFLDERLFAYWEETDFQYRLRAKGHKMGCLADVRAFHRVSSTTPRMKGKRFYYIWRNRIIFHKRHSKGLAANIAFNLITFLGWVPGMALLQAFGRRPPGTLKYCYWAVLDGYAGRFDRKLD